MLLLFLLTAFTVPCTHSSSTRWHHKYPFVFLLDVGNEELGAYSTEQIKVSIPGGDLALKYPATGQGDVISHVRVTGIDYGTDLKANIVDGGPGYRYVVLMFVGNPGVQYDTVVTIQTLSDMGINEGQSLHAKSDSYKVVEDEDSKNNSAEETDDESEVKSDYSEKIDAEYTQSSSNIYRYVQSKDFNVQNQEKDSDKDDNEDDNGDEDDEVDNNEDFKLNTVEEGDDSVSDSQSDTTYAEKHIQTFEDDKQSYNEEIDEGDNDSADNINNVDISPESNSGSNYESRYPIKILNSYEENNENNGVESDNSIKNSDKNYDSILNMLSSGKLFAFKPQFYGELRMYPQVAVPSDRSLVDHSEDDDEQVQSDGQNDSSNNIDDYASPVEY